jgi:hypothetical protein
MYCIACIAVLAEAQIFPKLTALRQCWDQMRSCKSPIYYDSISTATLTIRRNWIAHTLHWVLTSARVVLAVLYKTCWVHNIIACNERRFLQRVAFPHDRCCISVGNAISRRRHARVVSGVDDVVCRVSVIVATKSARPPLESSRNGHCHTITTVPLQCDTDSCCHAKPSFRWIGNSEYCSKICISKKLNME